MKAAVRNFNSKFRRECEERPALVVGAVSLMAPLLALLLILISQSF